MRHFLDEQNAVHQVGTTNTRGEQATSDAAQLSASPDFVLFLESINRPFICLRYLASNEALAAASLSLQNSILFLPVWVVIAANVPTSSH